FTQHSAHEQFTSHENIFIDTDNDAATGHTLFLGSEMLIQGGAAYDERGGGFNEGDVNGLNWAAAPAGAATDFEMRISRDAIYAKDNAPVFASDTIAFILESEDTNFVRKDSAPDAEGLTYTFTPAPAPVTGSVNLITMGSTTWRHFTPENAAGALDASWKTASFDDGSWGTGAGAFGYPAQGGFISIQTPIPSGKPVFYLRTKFDWTNDTTGIVLAATAKLSDGAVIYLNGQEARRLRMPEGPINYNTAARDSGPANNPEIFGIPAGALVVGENILAVEVHDRVQGAIDLAFDMGLQASTSYPVVITDSTQPADRSVVAGQSTTFTVEVLGTGPLTYQWLKNNEPIQGANGPTYTIAQALAADAGAYSVHVTNAGGSVTSRAAQLTVTGTPVVITNANLPANVTATQGSSVTFTVDATGSAPVSYQWFNGTTAIDGATSASYTIPSVAAGDAGNYFVRVSNPVNSVDSRKAVLTVNSDVTAPTIVSVSGSPNTVLVTFSEPFDPTSAVAGNFQLSGGVQVQTATPLSANPAQVALTTSAQTLGTQYTLTATGIKDRFGNTMAAGANQTFRSTILIDGSFNDWAGVEIAQTDEQESPAAGTDFKDIWVFSDKDYVYIRFSLYAPGNPNTFLNNIFIDADNTPTTGFGTYGIGSEMLIQSGDGYQEKNGAFNEGSINGLDFAVSPEGEGSEFELRISRDATYASNNQRVFTSDVIRFFLETENSSFVATDTAPNTGGLQVTLFGASAGSLSIAREGGSTVISWTGTGRLQFRPSLTAGDWVDVDPADNPYTVTQTDAMGFYRLAQ
ncbi:MAG TPA: immunoglobulin domain-containing protein, partial [Verrucomicrobiae bacterium]|nr:immunoglobulin domain-containing protein [Verrucomicrobiae bacterium]